MTAVTSKTGELKIISGPEDSSDAELSASQRQGNYIILLGCFKQCHLLVFNNGDCNSFLELAMQV